MGCKSSQERTARHNFQIQFSSTGVPVVQLSTSTAVPPPAPVDPPLPTPPMLPQNLLRFRARLVRFYQHHNPSKLPQVDFLLKKYGSMEHAIFEALVAKYGPEPQSMYVDPTRLAGHLTVDEDFAYLNPPPSEFECAICLQTWWDPDEVVPCEHIFCHRCLMSVTTMKCPDCRESVGGTKVPHRALRSQLDNLPVRCLRCDWTGIRQQLPNHVKNMCKGVPKLGASDLEIEEK